MKKDTHIIIGICLVFLCAAIFLIFQGQKETVVTGTLFSTSEQTERSDTEAFLSIEQPDSIEKTEKDSESAVSVIGAVKHPGIYRYHGSARIYDAIEALGGFKKNAAKESVNPAKLLTDGEQICVLTKKQMKKQKKEQKNGRNTSKNFSGQELLNINQASKEDLMTLPGIGEAKAMLIIDYRTEHGSFTRPDDLMKISGIKEGVFNKIKALITTE